MFKSLLHTDNSTKCVGGLASHMELIYRNVMPESYFCKVENGEQPPTYVRLGTDKTCKPSSLSKPIPVWNREKLDTPPDGVGVCVHGCVYTLNKNSNKAYKDIVQFLAMVKVLGAKVVSLYILNIDHAMLESVMRVYPDFLDVVQWINLNNSGLHYYGQRISINDCLYRNMKRVKYVFMIDLDEMILPVSTKNWPDMIKELEAKGKYASYVFSNNFFAEVNDTNPERLGICPKEWGLPKYFTRLTRLPWPADRQKTKMKMLVRTEAISSLCIHDVCKHVLGGYKKFYNVPMSIGLMAHYREPVPYWYIFGKGTKDKTALHFQNAMETELREKCISLASNNTNFYI